MRRRRRRASRLELFYAAVIAALMVGGSVWLDRSGTLVTAEVAGKRERIVVGYEPMGEWDRYYEVSAAFEQSDGGRWQAFVRVPEARYDSLRAGDSIEVRYLPQFPALARTSDRSTVTALAEFGSRLAAIPILAWLAIGIPALWIAARIGAIAVVGVSAAWAVVAWTMLFTLPSREGPRPMEAVAEVRGITLVDRSPEHVRQTRAHTGRFDNRLAVPYQVVQLALMPGSAGDTVLAVDAVDSGSVSGLAHGARLPVRLDPGAPREAQLAGGTRSFVTANRFHFLIPGLGCVILGALIALGLAWKRRERRQRTATSSAPTFAAAAIAVLTFCLPGAVAAQSSARHGPVTPGVDTVRVGCGGGMNGGNSGWLLARTGRITRFSGRTELTLIDAGEDPDAVARVFAELDRIGIRSRAESERRPIPDAIICSVKIGSVPRRGEIHWLYGRIPPEIEPALAAIDSAVGGGESGAWRNHWQRTGDVWP